MSQPRITYDEVLKILDRIELKHRSFRLGTMDHGFFIQIQYTEKCIDTGKIELQKNGPATASTPSASRATSRTSCGRAPSMRATTRR